MIVCVSVVRCADDFLEWHVFINFYLGWRWSFNISQFLSNLKIFFSTGGRLHKREIYTGLVNRLSDKDFYSEYTLDSLEQILNLVLVDHSLTGCLLALSHKTKKVSSFFFICFYFVLGFLESKKMMILLRGILMLLVKALESVTFEEFSPYFSFFLSIVAI